MFKLFLSLVFIAILCSCKTSVVSQRDRDERARKIILASKIKERHLYSYNYKFGEVDSSSKFLSMKILYDDRGNTVKEINYSDAKNHQSPPDTTYYFYDDNNCAKLIKKITYEIESDTTITDSTAVVTDTSSYNTNSNTFLDSTVIDTVVEESETNIYQPISYQHAMPVSNTPFHRTVSKYVYTYDENFNKATMKYIVDDVLINVINYTYADDNQMLKATAYTADNKVSSRTEYTYSANIQSGWNEYGENNELFERVSTSYLPDKKQRNSVYNSEGKLIRVELIKWDNGDVLEYVVDNKVANSIEKVVREYYKQGLVKAIKRFRDEEPIEFKQGIIIY
ncbi:hypothetical protein [Pedobacter miscanthi]|uniref:Uncharacterized protein n=1 Tax=Pedobacter miscanthi TaxID=2259170 RepID=A0A366KNG8_9SPHI|nr:hypothetical protein [Pedobacter miscanthi]RBQ02823.1 hypothetical protein DRW42_24545 [Pedobacter miscanthi]